MENKNNIEEERIASPKGFEIIDINIYDYLSIILQQSKKLFLFFIIFLSGTFFILTFSVKDINFVNSTVIIDDKELPLLQNYKLSKLDSLSTRERFMIDKIEITSIETFTEQLGPVIVPISSVNFVYDLSIRELINLLKSQKNYLNFLIENSKFREKYSTFFNSILYLPENKKEKFRSNDNLSKSVTLIIKEVSEDSLSEVEELLNAYVTFTLNEYNIRINKKLTYKLSALSSSLDEDLDALEYYTNENAILLVNRIYRHLISLNQKLDLCKKYIEKCNVENSEIIFRDNFSNPSIDAYKIGQFSIDWLNEAITFYSAYNSFDVVNDLYIEKYSNIAEYLKNYSDYLDRVSNDYIINTNDYIYIDWEASKYYEKLIKEDIASEQKSLFSKLTLSIFLSIILIMLSIVIMFIYKGYNSYKKSF